ncbi:hypothetical protein SAMN06298216_3546 [Spirosomataceae bacterium TFI 002]|nr:hypothetical protein SAMN06298216_3546 [Spirosomataceae bacterium TFI 002]
MNRVLKLVNHTPSQAQIKQLQEDWNANQIIDLPSELALKFSNVPPELIDLKPLALEFLSWIEDQKLQPTEPVWIQGESGLSFLIIQKLLAENYTVIHATTIRNVIEEKGIKKSIFEHLLFRKFQII